MSGERPVFATDWDDVCYEFAKYFLPYYNQLHGTDFEPHQLLDHDLSLFFRRDLEHILETVDDFHDQGESVSQGLIEGTSQVIPPLAADYDIVIITARKDRFKTNIQEMVDEYLAGSIRDIYTEKDILLAGNKGKLAKSLGAVAMVDDHIDNVFSIRAEGIRAMLRNMPKNFYHPLTIERVNDWYDIYQKLTGHPFNQL